MYLCGVSREEADGIIGERRVLAEIAQRWALPQQLQAEAARMRAELSSLAVVSMDSIATECGKVAAFGSRGKAGGEK